MHLTGLTRAFYMAHNKNTDELYAERLEYDPVDAAQLMARAERIIYSPDLLPKAFEDPTSKAAFACSWCQHKGVCHNGEMPRSNCRTCLHRTPVDGGWHCARHDRMLATEEQRKGCSNHLFIPSLIPGEQVDASEVDETVTYRMPNGELWVDGAKA
jgi:hypothetical protein